MGNNQISQTGVARVLPDLREGDDKGDGQNDLGHHKGLVQHKMDRPFPLEPPRAGRRQRRGNGADQPGKSGEEQRRGASGDKGVVCRTHLAEHLGVSLARGIVSVVLAMALALILASIVRRFAVLDETVERRILTFFNAFPSVG